MVVAKWPGMTKPAWPLYLTIAAAAAASMATSAPPTWHEAQVFQGPDVRLDQARPTGAATFTIHASKRYADPVVEIVGLVRYELEGDAPQDLRIALVAPDQDVLVEQIHPLEGAGRIWFSLQSWEQLACASGAKVCEQTMALEFDAGSVPGGAIDIEWYLEAQTGAEGTEPPENLVFEVDVDGGQPLLELPWLSAAEPPTDETGNGRWRRAEDGLVRLALGASSRRETRRFSVRSGGGFSSSQLSMSVSMSTSQPAPVDLRLAVLSDEPGAGVVAERVVTFSGDSETAFEIRLPGLLDCPDGACTRDFVLVFDTADEITLRADVSVGIHASVDGEGEQPPADVELAVEIEDPFAM